MTNLPPELLRFLLMQKGLAPMMGGQPMPQQGMAPMMQQPQQPQMQPQQMLSDDPAFGSPMTQILRGLGSGRFGM